MVGLSDVAGRRVGGFSLGMRQRLSLAGALLGDPDVLVFDEPLNGLDPDGIRWLRGLLRELAAQNRTVFVSSHLLSEVAQTVDEVVVLARGRLMAQTTLSDLVARTSVVRARTTDASRLLAVLAAAGLQVSLAAIVPGIEKWLPTAAAIGLTNAPGPDPGRALSPTAAGLVLTGYAIALLVAASRTTMCRDVT